MAKPVLYYFEGRGKAEIGRLTLAAVGIDVSCLDRLVYYRLLCFKSSLVVFFSIVGWGALYRTWTIGQNKKWCVLHLFCRF